MPSYSDPSSISTFKLPLSGSGQALQKMKFTMSGKGPRADRQDRPHPHSATADPTGKFLIAPDLGADLIRIFSIDSTSGQLTACTAGEAGRADGPRHGAFWTPKAGSTEGTMLYVVNELGNSVGVYTVSYGGSCMSVKKVQNVSTYPPGKTPASDAKAAEVHIAGNFVYAVNRNDKGFGAQQDSVATYSIDPATGNLKYIENTNAYSYYPRTFQINKAGDMVAFGGQTSSNVAIVSRDPSTGKLGSLVASVQVGTPGRAGQEDGLSAVIWNE